MRLVAYSSISSANSTFLTAKRPSYVNEAPPKCHKAHRRPPQSAPQVSTKQTDPPELLKHTEPREAPQISVSFLLAFIGLWPIDQGEVARPKRVSSPPGDPEIS